MCKIEWCNNKPCVSGKGYCRGHYDQIRKYGKILNERPKGKRNEYVLHDDYAELLILNKDESVKVRVLVDKEDIDKLKSYSFRYDVGHYIKSVRNGVTKYLHRIVMNYEGDLEIDHINRNKLDNRKSNLRIVTRKENANNLEKKDSYGIIDTKRKLTKPIKVCVNRINYGYYKTIEEARKVRDSILAN